MQKTIVFKPQSFFQLGKNVRETMPSEEELRALALSYKQRWLAPVIAMVTGLLIDGYCRLAGLKLVDPEWLVPTILTEDQLKPAEVTRLQMVSAIQRNGLAAHDISKGIDEMRKDDPSLTNAAIADMLGFADASLVTRYEAWRNCVEPIQQKYFAGEIGVSKVYELSKQQAPAQQEMVEQNLLTASRSEMKAHIKRSENGTTHKAVRKPRKKPAPPITIPVGKATVSVRGSEGMNLVDVAAFLQVVSEAACSAAKNGDTLENWLNEMAEQHWLSTLPVAEEAEEECLASTAQ